MSPENPCDKDLALRVMLLEVVPLGGGIVSERSGLVKSLVLLDQALERERVGLQPFSHFWSSGPEYSSMTGFQPLTAWHHTRSLTSLRSYGLKALKLQVKINFTLYRCAGYSVSAREAD